MEYSGEENQPAFALNQSNELEFSSNPQKDDLPTSRIGFAERRLQREAQKVAERAIDTEILAQLIATCRAESQSSTEYRSSLPCGPWYPKIDFDAALHNPSILAKAVCSDKVAAAKACQDKAGFTHCRYAKNPNTCPIEELSETYQFTKLRLENGAVDLREKEIILAAVRPISPIPLLKTGPLQVIRAVLQRKRTQVSFQLKKTVSINGGESVICLSGSMGVGKTFAADYAIAREGGLYTTCHQFTRPGLDLDKIIKMKGVLVIDQLGRETMGASDWYSSCLEDVIDRRNSGCLLTILIGNLSEDDFKVRYKQVITERLKLGIFAEFKGPSLRGKTWDEMSKLIQDGMQSYGAYGA